MHTGGPPSSSSEYLEEKRHIQWTGLTAMCAGDDCDTQSLMADSFGQELCSREDEEDIHHCKF